MKLIREAFALQRSSARFDIWRLLLWPVVGFVATLAVTSAQDVARNPQCQGVRAFFSQLILRTQVPVDCSSVPFLVDTPTVILSFTAPFAAIAYLILVRRLSSLGEALNASGLLRTSRTALLSAFDRIAQLAYNPRWHVPVAAIAIALTIWLYTRNLATGGIFQTLASERYDAETLTFRWWANYRTHPYLAFHCVFIGVVGVHFSLMSVLVYAKMAWELVRRVRSDQSSVFRYVPRWRDPSFGWQPALSIAVLAYFTAINFALSMIAVYDMLKGGVVDQTVATFFIALGVVTNFSLVFSWFWFIRSRHGRIRARLETDVSRVLRRAESPTPSMRLTSLRRSNRSNLTASAQTAHILIATQDLQNWPGFPFPSRWIGPFRLLIPGVAAGVQLFRTLSGGF